MHIPATLFVPLSSSQSPGVTESRCLLVAGLAESLINFRGPLIYALIERGIDVHVAAPCMGPSTPTRVQLESRGVTVHNIPLHRTGTAPWADLRTLIALWSLIRRVRPTHVLSYTIKPVIYGTLAAWMAGVPNRFALITGLGYAFTGDRRGKREFMRSLVRNLYSLALQRSTKVIYQNPDDAALFRTLGIVPPAKASCVVNGSGVDLAHFVSVPVPSGAPRFLLIARLLGDKGVREYEKAARQVRAAHPEVRFALAGWIDENPDAIEQRELDEWVAAGSIEFLGKLGDVRPALADCTVYVLPSYREGTPRTVLEAIATGRPVITTDAPGCRETVIHGANGFLVPVKSVDALAQAMLRFVESPTLAARMGVDARKIAEQKYDVHKVNAAMLSEMGVLPASDQARV